MTELKMYGEFVLVENAHRFEQWKQETGNFRARGEWVPYPVILTPETDHCEGRNFDYLTLEDVHGLLKLLEPTETAS